MLEVLEDAVAPSMSRSPRSGPGSSPSSPRRASRSASSATFSRRASTRTSRSGRPRHGDRGSGDPLGGRVPRLPGRSRGFTSGGTCPTHRPRGGARAGDPGLAAPGSQVDARSTARRRPTTRSSAQPSCSASARQRAGAPDRRPIGGSFPRPSPGDPRRPRSRVCPRRGGRDGRHHAHRRRRPDRGYSPTSARTRASGSTSTEPTASPPQLRRRPRTCSWGSTAPTRSRSMPTSGSSFPRPAGCSSCAVARISSTRSRTTRRTSRTSGRATWSTSPWSTRDRSGP